MAPIAWPEPASASQTPHYRLPRIQIPRARTPHVPRNWRTRVEAGHERITSYTSDVVVERDGRLLVRESIRVVSTGIKIRHGIYRDLPAYDRDPAGDRARLRIDVVSVKRDNHDEPYTIDMLSHAWRIRVGDSSVVIPKGTHEYEILYRTNPRVGFFTGYDEVYWNITGNDWDFEIEQAIASFEFPEGAKMQRFAFYTGPPGSRDQRAVAERRTDRYLVVRSTAHLPKGHGLTVGVAIAKGAVAEPDFDQRIAQFAHDYRDTAAVLVGLMVLLAYYLVVWNAIGRDPDAGPVAPLYEPPKGISPAGARYVMRMGYDRKAFAATIVSLAVKGVLRIEDEPGVFQHTFTVQRGDGGGGELFPTETATASALLLQGEVALTQENQPIVARAISALKEALRYEFEKVYFVTNSYWFGGGVVIVALSALAAAFLSDSVSDTVIVFEFAAMFGLIAGSLGFRAANHWQAVFTRHGSRAFEFIRALWWTAATLPALGAVFYAMFFISDAMSPLTIAALAAEGFVACVFYELLKRPTAAGARLRNELKGFRMFLEMTETDRMELQHPVHVTPEVFEKYLPFAIALDAENAWGRRFESDIALAAVPAMAAQSGYAPRWYLSSYRDDGFSGFVGSLGSSLGDAAATASFSMSGGSGSSGGGGFSGGGGGGGGGGGW